MLDFLCYNPILRGIIEAYMELITICFLNIPNVSKDKSYSIASSIAGVIISIALVLPFLIMSILSIHYERLKTKKFDKKHGAITEGVEIEDRNTWKTLYYPIFLM